MNRSATDPESFQQAFRDHVMQALLRDLAAVEREVMAYPDDETLWRIAPGIANPGGVLALHLAGNIRQNIGANLGGSGYTRDRDAEFSARGLPRAQVASQVADASAQVSRALTELDPAIMGQIYPVRLYDRSYRTDAILLHILTHTAYHLGQIDYHRRMTSGDDALADTLSLSAMAMPEPK